MDIKQLNALVNSNVGMRGRCDSYVEKMASDIHGGRVRHTRGASEGANSSSFHQYRMAKRREKYRKALMYNQIRKEDSLISLHSGLFIQKLEKDRKTAKKRKKRERARKRKLEMAQGIYVPHTSVGERKLNSLTVISESVAEPELTDNTPSPVNNSSNSDPLGEVPNISISDPLQEVPESSCSDQIYPSPGNSHVSNSAIEADPVINVPGGGLKDPPSDEIATDDLQQNNVGNVQSSGKSEGDQPNENVTGCKELVTKFEKRDNNSEINLLVQSNGDENVVCGSDVQPSHDESDGNVLSALANAFEDFDSDSDF